MSPGARGRRAGSPRRLVLAYTIDGPGIDRSAAERAIDLAVTKYCSVRASLDRRFRSSSL